MTGESKLLVAEVPNKGGNVLRVTLDTSHGRWRISVREWFRVNSGEWRPGDASISFGREAVEPLAAAILLALKIGGAR